MFKCMYNVTYIDTPLVELDLTQGFPTASMPFKKKLYLQGGRSWQAFGKRKKCLQFFRRTRIC